jgi:Zn-dependent protease
MASIIPDGYVPEHSMLGRGTSGSWSLHLSYLGGTDVRLHVHFPLLVLLVAFATLGNYSPQDYSPQDYSVRGPLAESLWSRSSWDRLQPAALGLLILLGSVAIHELGRMVVVRRLGGRFEKIILGPTGGRTIPRLPGNPTVHLVTALIGPLVHLALMVTAACGLVLAGQQQVLELLKPFAPNLQISGSWLLLSAQFIVWLNWLLLLINLLPVDPLDGAALVRSLLWPVMGRASESVVASRIATACALLVVVFAVNYQEVMVDTMLGFPVPVWLPLGVLAVMLMWGANHDAKAARVPSELVFESFESDEQVWAESVWRANDYAKEGDPGEDREAVLVERMYDKQQEVLERKRREQEANEDARVDAILARLHCSSVEELSEEERTILKRASRRYRQRQEKI